PQGNSLLSGTIRNNLRIAKPDATEEEMMSALHDAAADFVHDLKFGLETTCGEHGDGLSEGQAQRIAIARGLLSSGSILLLDEISSSLDEDTEKLLLHRLSRRKDSRTILFVTHRMGVLPYCDEILRL
ncbi:MAG: ABC transporter ATP-binding protein/permease, partial [Muribaculaceae bacterium]|nr:ABC transporter ATP-binding protein/permease [Muribaculaceae bacterium]